MPIRMNINRSVKRFIFIRILRFISIFPNTLHTPNTPQTPD
jgi:hypothetical protein